MTGPGNNCSQYKARRLDGPYFPCAAMFLRSALVTIFALPALISGGLISRGSGPGDSSACTPGKLRGVVENSCICGGVLLFNMHPLSYSQFWQRNQVSIRLPDMVTWLRIRVSGLYLTPGFSLFFLNLCSTNRFWFFAARHNPDKAPLITWFNGGVSDTVVDQFCNPQRIPLARKFQHDWLVSRDWSLPYQ